jgi:hypothetical protein
MGQVPREPVLLRRGGYAHATKSRQLGWPVQKIEIGEHRNRFQVVAVEMNRYSGAMRTFLLIFALTVIGAAPATAKTVSPLAKKCQQMALQAHPADLPDQRAAADLRRSYYKLCVRRRGNMDPELKNPR